MVRSKRQKGCFFILGPLLGVGLCLQVGCASSNALNARIDLLKQEIADINQANRRLEQRMDELQIQLSQLVNKLKNTSEQPRQKIQGSTLLSGQQLPLVTVEAAPVVLSNKSKKVVGASAAPRATSSVNPSVTHEQLSVDVPAAQQSLISGTADHSADNRANK